MSKMVVVEEKAADIKVPAKTKKAQAALDVWVRRVHELRHAVNVSMWALGAAIQEIHQSRAWEARGAHKSFACFCEVELKLSVATANRLIFISQKFTEEQARAFGVPKLSEIRPAPEPYWPELLALCERGATVTQLRQRVREIKRAEGKRVVVRHSNARGSTSAATIAAAEKRNAKREVDAKVLPQVTLTAQEWSIATLARRGPGDKAAKPARSIAQQPTGTFAIAGAGTVQFSLFEGDGGAICVDAKFTPEARAA